MPQVIFFHKDLQTIYGSSTKKTEDVVNPKTPGHFTLTQKLVPVTQKLLVLLKKIFSVTQEILLKLNLLETFDAVGCSFQLK